MDLSPLEWLLIITTLLEFNPLFQTIKAVRRKSVQDISLLTFSSIMIIGALWLYYGITISNIPLIIGNAIKLATSFSVVGLIFYYKKKGKK